MSIPLKILTGAVRQFAVTDDLDIDDIIRRSGAGTNMTVGSNLGVDELRLASPTSDVRVMGDLIVDGSSTISVNETVVGNFQVDGNTILGNAVTDTITITAELLGNFIPDVNITSNLGSTAQSFLTVHSQTLVMPESAGDPVAIGNNGQLYVKDAAGISQLFYEDDAGTVYQLTPTAGAATLQSAYNTGNTIAVAGGLAVDISTAGAANALELETTSTGDAAQITTSVAAAGRALFINNAGSGNALQVQDGGSNVLLIDALGNLTVTNSAGVAAAGSATSVTAGAGAAGFVGGAVSVTSGAGAGGVSGTAPGAITVTVGASGAATTGTGGTGAPIALVGAAGGGSTGAAGTGGVGSAVTVTGGAGGVSVGAASTGGAGGALALTAGAGAAGTAFNGAGGAITVTAGAAGGVGPASGGTVDVTGGVATGTGSSGAVTVAGGTSAGAGSTGGGLTARGGEGSGTGTGGNATLRGGDAASTGLPGSVTVRGGNSVSANGGDVSISGGTPTTLGDGGDITLRAGTRAGASVMGQVLVTTDGQTYTAVLAQEGLRLDPVAGVGTDDASLFLFGSAGGNPTAQVTAGNPGSIAMRADGTAWVKTANPSSWSQLATTTGSVTLQSAYDAGDTITISASDGNILFEQTAGAINTGVLSINMVPAGFDSGQALAIATNSFVSGEALFVNNAGTGDALHVQDAGFSILRITDSGAMLVTNTTPTLGAGAEFDVQAGDGAANSTGGRVDTRAGAGGADAANTFAGIGGAWIGLAGTGGAAPILTSQGGAGGAWTGQGGIGGAVTFATAIQAGVGGAWSGGGGTGGAATAGTLNGRVGGVADLTGGAGGDSTGGIGGNGAACNIIGGAAGFGSTTTAAGGAVNVTGGTPDTTGTAGSVFITGGAATSTGAPGNVTITGGAPATNTGGAVNLVGGTPTTGGIGGAVSLMAGNAAGAFVGGGISALSGDGTNGVGGTASGNIAVTLGFPGTATTAVGGSGGDFTVLGAAGGAASGASGTGGNGSDIVVTSGAGGAAPGVTSTGGVGGSQTYTAGNGGAGTSVNGAGGSISLRAGADGAVTPTTTNTVRITTRSVVASAISAQQALQFVPFAGALAGDEASIFFTSGDPNGNLALGGAGSLALRNNGSVYVKTGDDPATTWSLLATATGSVSLQSAYETGNTIAVTTAEGSVAISNDTDLTDALTVSRAPAGATAGRGIAVTMGANTTSDGIQVSSTATASSGRAIAVDVTAGGMTGLYVRNQGTGDAVSVIDGAATQVVLIDASGGIALTAQAASNYTTAAGALTITAAATSTWSTTAGNLTLDAFGELFLDDTGNWGGTLSQTGDRTLDETGAGELFFGITSIIGALNALVNAISVSGAVIVEIPIENTVTVTAGDVVASSTVAGRCTQADANGNANGNFLGIALNTATGNVGGTNVSRVACAGKVTDAGAAFAQGAIFIDDGTGRPSSTAPSGSGDLVFRVGFAYSGTEYIIQCGEGTVLA